MLELGSDLGRVTMSVLGACWVQPILGENHDVGEIQLAGKEAHMERKHTCKRRKACEARMQEDLTMLGLGFW
jgi:hypothetical protein